MTTTTNETNDQATLNTIEAFASKCPRAKPIDPVRVLKRVSNKANKTAAKRVLAPSSSNPREELNRLVKQHYALTKQSVAVGNMAMDKTNKTTGELIPNNLPQDVKVTFLVAADDAKQAADKLEPALLKCLEQLPIYQHFLSNVYGCGAIVAAYICSEVDITKAVKPSNLRRYCGMAVIDGRLEHPTKGETLKYNGTMRTRLYQMFAAMLKNGARSTKASPYGVTTKYLDVWDGIKHREESAGRKGGNSKGWHKSADVFLEDLYMIWRAIEGLPVWPSYYASKLGYSHGGKICVNAPKMLSVEEAVAMVGDVGSVSLKTPRVVEPIPEEEDVAAE